MDDCCRRQKEAPHLISKTGKKHTHGHTVISWYVHDKSLHEIRQGKVTQYNRKTKQKAVIFYKEKLAASDGIQTHPLMD